MALSSGTGVGTRLDLDGPLMQGMVWTGSVYIGRGKTVECGKTFVWWRLDAHGGGRGKRELFRVVAAAPAGLLAGRVIVYHVETGERIVFSDEVELWTPPTERSPHARARLRHLVGDPLR